MAKETDDIPIGHNITNVFSIGLFNVVMENYLEKTASQQGHQTTWGIVHGYVEEVDFSCALNLRNLLLETYVLIFVSRPSDMVHELRA